ncbi:MAG: Zinc carboxypeptidase [Acidobacteria bacterium]|nr:Zinc carboxypeptidase [Acidobacteriota bacterium]
MNRFLFIVVALLLAIPGFAQQAVDADYTAQIRQFTTGPNFTTELVDHLPASATVPTPLKFFGHVVGAEGYLTYAEDVYRYMRALETVSPRVKVFSLGKSEEGREMIVVAVSNEETIANLDKYKDITRRLSDPRKLTDDAAKALIESGKPMYYATGAMHSPETGSPEMLMELAYRLAVEETPRIKAIRDNVIVLITPVLEVDGRDRMVDLWNYRKANPNVPTPPLVYWGHYVAHDNNRDNIGLALNLSRNVMRAYFDFHPQVIHDLHESVPFIYISTGTGPYNASLDPVMIDEWHRMAYHEVGELTQRGLPGAWTHGFYDGWAPNYMFWIGMGHNTIGRFYETFGNRWPTTENRVVRGASDRQWFRPNPPLPQVRWSLRNNVNYQQSALLFALTDMAENRRHFLEQFYLLGKRSIAKATNEGPYAYVIDGAQKRPGNVFDLLSTLRAHGVEVQVADAPFTMKTNWPPPAPPVPNAKTPVEPPAAITFAKGSYIVRMDQPYSRLADTLLDVQYVRSDEKVYDDTGWTLGYLKNVDVKRVQNADVLKVAMHEWDGARSTVASAPSNADVDFAKQWWANAKTSGAKTPRIAILHTWLRTQDEGWYRIAFDSMNVPYKYISTQYVSRTPNLRELFDVIVFPPSGGNSPQEIVNGMPPGPPLPWRKTALTPNLGVDETDDMRPGLGMSGVASLQQFVEDGGLLITARDTSEWAVTYGLARWVSIVDTNKLKAPGTIVSAEIVDKKSPIAAGYDDTLPIYFAGSPVFKVGVRDESTSESRASGRGGKNDPDVPQGRAYVPLPDRGTAAPGEEGFRVPEDAPYNFEPYMPRAEDRPRVVVAFAKKADQLLMSGMLEGGDEIAGKPVVIDAPRGKGHILLFANNPMWRHNTQGSYALIMNAIINWDHLR